MASGRIPITREGYDRKKAELDRLKNVEMIEIAKRIATARDLGDLSENAEYHAAKERQSLVQARVSMLRQRVSEIQLMSLDRIPKDKAGFGSKLTVIENGKTFSYELVMPEDANPEQGLISVASPLGTMTQTRFGEARLSTSSFTV